MIPTFRFYSLLILGGVLSWALAIARHQTLALGSLGVYDLVLILATIWDSYREKKYRVKIQRSPLSPLSIGRENPVTLTLQTSPRATQVLIKDDFPQVFTADQIQLQTPLTQPEITLTYHVQPSHRGDYTWGNLHLRQLGLWGLAWYSWSVPATQSVAVYPDLLALRSLTIQLTLESSGTLRQARRLGLGTEFAELRDYQPGDDIRYLDWKASARRHRPLMRVLEPDREQTVMILLDRGRLMKAQVQGLQRFDWGLNTALSLALTALHRGDRVGVGVFDRDILTWIPPDRGQSHLAHLIERLTPIQPVLLEPDYVGAVTQLTQQQTRRALVVLLTDLVDQTASAELLGAMARLTPRYLPFCVALRDPKVDEMAQTPSQGVHQAYRQAVALDLMNQRQTAFAQLKQKGVLVLDAPAPQVSHQLVERYLQLKAKNLL
ncbi:MAG: DUF58 domain-containing protein [Microcystaceae cyanobacterium]